MFQFILYRLIGLCLFYKFVFCKTIDPLIYQNHFVSIHCVSSLTHVLFKRSPSTFDGVICFSLYSVPCSPRLAQSQFPPPLHRSRRPWSILQPPAGLTVPASSSVAHCPPPHIGIFSFISRVLGRIPANLGFAERVTMLRCRVYLRWKALHVLSL